MGSSLGSLVIDIAANTAKFSSDMERTVQLAEAGMKRIESVANLAAMALGAVGVGLSIGSIVDSIKHTAEFADQLGQVSEQSGIAVEDLSALRFAARQADTDFEAVTGALKKLRLTQTEASTGNKELAHLFGEVGVSLQDIRELSQKDLFLKTLQGISELGTESERTTALTKLLGKSADELGVFANQGADGIRRLMGEAREMGAVIDGETVRATKAMNDNIKAMDDSAQSLSITLLSNLAPHLKDITDAMREAAKDGGVLNALFVGMGGVLSESIDAVSLSSVRNQIETIEDRITALNAVASQPETFFNGGRIKTAKIELENFNRELDSLKKKLPADPIKLPIDPVDGGAKDKSNTRHLGDFGAQEAAAKKLEAIEDARKKKIAEVVTQMERQSATVGEAAAVTKVYELQQLKATDADIARARAAQKIVDTYNEQQDVYKNQVSLLDRMGELRAEALSPEQRALEELQAKYAEVDEARNGKNPLISQDEADKTKSGLSTNFINDIVDPAETELEKLQDSYDKKQQMLDEAHAKGLASEDDYLSALGKLNDKFEKDKTKLQAAALSQQLQNAGQLADGLAGLAAVTAGKQSGLYKAMFAASKAFAIADTIVKIQAGIASAAAAPWPANIAAIGSVVAATGSIVSTIKSTNMGQAHGGLDYVPEDATYVLKAGERVLAPKQNSDLSNFLANGGGSGLTVNIIEDRSRAGSAEQNGNTLDVYVAKVREAVASDIISGGTGIARALENTYGVGRGAGARR